MYDVRCTLSVRPHPYQRRRIYTYAKFVLSERRLYLYIRNHCTVGMVDMLECNIRNNCTVLGVWAMYIFANFYVDDCTIGTTYGFALLECNKRNNCTVLAVWAMFYIIYHLLYVYIFCYMCMLIFAITPKNNHIHVWIEIIVYITYNFLCVFSYLQLCPRIIICMY